MLDRVNESERDDIYKKIVFLPMPVIKGKTKSRHFLGGSVIVVANYSNEKREMINNFLKFILGNNEKYSEQYIQTFKTFGFIPPLYQNRARLYKDIPDHISSVLEYGIVHNYVYPPVSNFGLHVEKPINVSLYSSLSILRTGNSVDDAQYVIEMAKKEINFNINPIIKYKTAIVTFIFFFIFVLFITLLWHYKRQQYKALGRVFVHGKLLSSIGALHRSSAKPQDADRFYNTGENHEFRWMKAKIDTVFWLLSENQIFRPLRKEDFEKAWCKSYWMVKDLHAFIDNKRESLSYELNNLKIDMDRIFRLPGYMVEAATRIFIDNTINYLTSNSIHIGDMASFGSIQMYHQEKDIIILKIENKVFNSNDGRHFIKRYKRAMSFRLPADLMSQGSNVVSGLGLLAIANIKKIFCSDIDIVVKSYNERVEAKLYFYLEDLNVN